MHIQRIKRFVIQKLSWSWSHSQPVNQSEKIYNIVHGDMDITLQKSLGDCLNVYRMSRINKYCSCVNRSAISNWYRDKLLFCVL